MAFQNIKLRGGSYFWRKKITVADTPLSLSLALRTGNFKSARAIALRLGTTVEALRMAYGQSTGMNPEKLKQVFSDALRWQLQRILEDQAGSQTAAEDHATLNSIYAEAWDFFARRGVDARWTLVEHDLLIADGWSLANAKAVGDVVFDHQAAAPVSKTQLDSYVSAFGIEGTVDNLDRMKRTVCAARAAACRKATGQLSPEEDFTAAWTKDALIDDAPFAFDRIVSAVPTAPPAPAAPEAEVSGVDPRQPQPPAPEPLAALKPKKRLLDAAEECIALYEQEKAWSAVSIGQVRTAVRMFDHASGGEVFIENLEQQHVSEFMTMCRSLPSRWGNTKAEKAGGFAASLARAKTLDAADIGLSQVTINKHITWITTVLERAAGEEGAKGHRPATPLLFKFARAGIGKKSRHERKRAREKRANWTRPEIMRLLSAPIWTGSAAINRRLTPGTVIIHDAWYWMPLMLPLYGGRSSELGGLALNEIHEDDEIPYFQIDYTEDRPLKNVQSIRKLPIHPELIRLGFIDYVKQIRLAGCKMLFPELASPKSTSFASTFYKSIFKAWRTWAFPKGTDSLSRGAGAWQDKDVHSFRGAATSMLKGKVEDSVRCDIFGHEGETETSRTYDDETELAIKLEALKHLTPFTEHIQPSLPIRIRPANRLRFGARAPSQPSRLGQSKKAGG